MNAISVIVPTLNEVDNIAMLIERIAAGFKNNDTTYEIVFVDDNSTDGTMELINSLKSRYPIRAYTKQGPRGKAYSLLQGFETARYDTLCMIDADLQYPPEAIIPMYQLMESTGTDIVLTNRQEHNTPMIRKVTSAGFNFVFTKMLFGFDYDSQSGLKLFKKEVIDSITLSPTPWSFDLEFIVRSLEQNYKIASYDITFAERYAGVAKIQVGKVAYELAKASVKLRLNSSPRKVKYAYKQNTRILEKAMMVSAISLLALATTLIGQQPQVVALNNPVNVSPIISAVKDAGSTLTNSDNDDNKTEDEKPTTPPVVPQPQSKPMPTAQAPQATSSTSPAAAPRNQPTNTQTATLPTTTVAAATAGPQVLGVTTAEAPDLSDEATFPEGDKKIAAFGYANSAGTGNSMIFQNLAYISIAIAVAAIITYAVLTIKARSRLASSSGVLQG